MALLAYTLLQRQLQEQGLPMTTRRLIQRLDPLTVIETRCRDGSRLRRLTPIDPDLAAILDLVAAALEELMQTISDLNRPRCLPPDTQAGIHSRPRLLG